MGSLGHVDSVVAAGRLSCGMWDLSSPIRDRNQPPCIGSVEPYPLGHQGSPLSWLLLSHTLIAASVLSQWIQRKDTSILGSGWEVQVPDFPTPSKVYTIDFHLNYGVEEDSRESLGLQGDQTSQS